ncbi:MAG: hypothetical protein IPG53_23055 [Ignavibacteriales bacterium]|nr:hypothetical protein [Ignavibacteriales bacterium]
MFSKKRVQERRRRILYALIMDDSELLKLEISENENPFGLAGDILASPGKGKTLISLMRSLMMRTLRKRTL